jgi:hypothetical protein
MLIYILSEKSNARVSTYKFLTFSNPLVEAKLESPSKYLHYESQMLLSNPISKDSSKHADVSSYAVKTFDDVAK